MIEIPDQPAERDCPTCGARLLWQYSYATGRQWAGVAVPGDPLLIRLHACRAGQDPQVWRTARRVPAEDQADVNARGRRRVEQELKPSTTGDEQQ